MIKSIVYVSCTGYTKQYAEMLGDALSLDVYSLQDAKEKAEGNQEIIFLGWLNAGKVMGLPEALKNFSVKAVCGVGMAETGAQIMDIQKANSFPAGVPVFTLQGGFDMERLPGKYKLMMKVMKGTYGKKLAAKKDKTPEEQDMLDMLMNGGSRVSKENLKDIIEWYEKER